MDAQITQFGCPVDSDVPILNVKPWWKAYFRCFNKAWPSAELGRLLKTRGQVHAKKKFPLLDRHNRPMWKSKFGYLLSHSISTSEVWSRILMIWSLNPRIHSVLDDNAPQALKSTAVLSCCIYHHGPWRALALQFAWHGHSASGTSAIMLDRLLKAWTMVEVATPAKLDNLDISS